MIIDSNLFVNTSKIKQLGHSDICQVLISEVRGRKKEREADSRNVEMNPGGPGGYWYGYGYQQPQVTFFTATVSSSVCHILDMQHMFKCTINRTW